MPGAQAALLDKATDAIVICGPEEEVIYWNRSAERLYGWTAGEARGRNVHSLLHPAPPPQLAEARHSVRQRGEWQGELRQSGKDGSAIVVQSRWTLFRDEVGRPQSLLIVNTDARDLLLNESQFLRAQQTASIATLADVMARELRSAVEPVLLVSQLLRVRTQAGAAHWPETPDAPKLFHRFRPVVRGCAAWALEYDLWLFLAEDVLREGELRSVAEWPPGARKLRDVPETKCEPMGGE